MNVKATERVAIACSPAPTLQSRNIMRPTQYAPLQNGTPDTNAGGSRRARGSAANQADPDPEPPSARLRRNPGPTCIANETVPSRWGVNQGAFPQAVIPQTTIPQAIAKAVVAIVLTGLVALSSAASLQAAPDTAAAGLHGEKTAWDDSRAELEKAFRKLSAKRQLEVLAKLEKAVCDGDDRVAARLRAAWRVEGLRATPSRSGLRTRKRSSRRNRIKPRPHRWEGQVPFAVALGYRFPIKQVEAPTLTTGAKHKALRGRKLESELRLRHFRGLLDGFAKDTDALVANVLQTLDTDPGEDRFAAFLDGWQDKGKPFYVALDETAGTGKSVFFFDSMLAGFLRKVPTKVQRAPLARSLDAAHDALHAAFLNYRQYRALREAVALTLVLPPDTPLPEHLRTYGAANGYSTRDFIRLLLVTFDNDPARLILGLQRTAPALPSPLWGGKYEPLEPITTWFQSRIKHLDQHSDQVLDAAKTKASAAWQAARQRALGAAKDALL